MDLFQREIVDDRKVRINSYRETGVGSSGLLGLSPLASLSMVGSGASVDLARHNLVPPRRFDGQEFYRIHPEPAVWLVHHRSSAPRQGSGFRERELEWRRAHAEALRQYENEWVVLEGEQIIAHGSNAAQAIREAKLQGIQTPYIFFVEPESDDSVRIGL